MCGSLAQRPRGSYTRDVSSGKAMIALTMKMVRFTSMTVMMIMSVTAPLMAVLVATADETCRRYVLASLVCVVLCSRSLIDRSFASVVIAT